MRPCMATRSTRASRHSRASGDDARVIADDAERCRPASQSPRVVHGHDGSAHDGASTYRAVGPLTAEAWEFSRKEILLPGWMALRRHSLPARESVARESVERESVERESGSRCACVCGGRHTNGSRMHMCATVSARPHTCADVTVRTQPCAVHARPFARHERDACKSFTLRSPFASAVDGCGQRGGRRRARACPGRCMHALRRVRRVRDRRERARSHAPASVGVACTHARAGVGGCMLQARCVVRRVRRGATWVRSRSCAGLHETSSRGRGAACGCCAIRVRSKGFMKHAGRVRLRRRAARTATRLASRRESWRQPPREPAPVSAARPALARSGVRGASCRRPARGREMRSPIQTRE